MKRREFLVGTLVGVGGGVGVSHAARTLQDAADEANAEAPSSTDSPPRVPPEDLGPMPPDGRKLSYAQQGEDLIVAHTFETLEISRPTYLDIGAFHPTISSNTYLLYLQGSQGVLVEPNPPMAGMLREVRPRDTVLQVGVGVGEATSASYYVIANRPQLNTFSKGQVERYEAEAGRKLVQQIVEIALVPLGQIIEEHFDGAPDLLSVDVEGLDLEILRTLDFTTVRPAVLCVETVVYGTMGVRAELVDFLRGHDYIPRGGTFVNTIFVDRHRLNAAPDARVEV